MNTLDQHLTDDQFETLLMGDDAEPGAAAHTAACPQCHAKQQAFLSLVADFNQSSLAWANVRPLGAAGRELKYVTPERRWFSTSAYAFAASLLLLVTLFFARSSGHFGHSNPQPYQTASVELRPPARPTAAQLSQQDSQIAADNNLLAAIDSALNQPDSTLSLQSLSSTRNPDEDATHSAVVR